MPHRPRLDQSCSGPAPVGSGTTLLLARTELGTKPRCDPSNGPSAVEGEAAVPCTHRPFVLMTQSCPSRRLPRKAERAGQQRLLSRAIRRLARRQTWLTDRTNAAPVMMPVDAQPIPV